MYIAYGLSLRAFLALSKLVTALIADKRHENSTMPRALRQSFNREVERERAPQVQSRQAPDEVEQPLVDNMDEDESEGYGEEGDDDEEEEKGAFLMKPTLTTQTAVNRPLDQLNGDTIPPHIRS